MSRHNALRTIVKLMNEKIRETDFLARYGGRNSSW